MVPHPPDPIWAKLMTAPLVIDAGVVDGSLPLDALAAPNALMSNVSLSEPLFDAFPVNVMVVPETDEIVPICLPAVVVY